MPASPAPPTPPHCSDAWTWTTDGAWGGGKQCLCCCFISAHLPFAWATLLQWPQSWSRKKNSVSRLFGTGENSHSNAMTVWCWKVMDPLEPRSVKDSQDCPLPRDEGTTTRARVSLGDLGPCRWGSNHCSPREPVTPQHLFPWHLGTGTAAPIPGLSCLGLWLQEVPAGLLPKLGSDHGLGGFCFLL